MYYMTAFDGAPILNNNRLTVSVRGDEITRIRKDGPDLVLEAKKHIISQNEAYSRLIKGGGAYTLFQRQRPQNLPTAIWAIWSTVRVIICRYGILRLTRYYQTAARPSLRHMSQR